MKKTILNIALFVLISGCAVPQQRQVVQRAPADQAELAKIKTHGTSKISGQAFLRTRGGDVKKAAGSTVALNPVSSLSNQWHQAVCIDGNVLSGSAPAEYSALVKEKIADAEGRFIFENIAEGEYFLATNVLWQAPTRNGLSTQGGLLMKKVAVRSGEPIEAILTDGDLCQGARAR